MSAMYSLQCSNYSQIIPTLHHNEPPKITSCGSTALLYKLQTMIFQSCQYMINCLLTHTCTWIRFVTKYYVGKKLTLIYSVSCNTLYHEKCPFSLHVSTMHCMLPCAVLDFLQEIALSDTFVHPCP